MAVGMLGMKRRILAVVAMSAGLLVVPVAPAYAFLDTEWVKVVSGSDSNDKTVDAPCPRGKSTIAGGARISGPGEPYVHLTALAPMDELGYTATAQEYIGHTALPWELTTWAVCAKNPSGLEYVSDSTLFSSSTTQQQWAPCPRGKRAIGSGATIAGGNGQVHLVDMRVLEDRDTYAQAVETNIGYAFAWSLTAHSICTSDARHVARSAGPSTLQNPKAWVTQCNPQWPPNSVGFHLDGQAGTIGVNDVMVGPTTYAVTAYQFPSIHPEPWAIEAHTVCVQPTFG
jgi:hypothetical protein